MIRSVTTSLLCCALAGFAAGPGKVFPLAYDQRDLPNGLRLLTIPTDYPNVVALYIVVNAGSRNEVEPGRSGFAHLFEHMMFRGTKAFPQQQYAAALQSMGAAQNAFTTDDFTAYHITFSREDLPKVLEMEADRFQHLLYTPAVFKTETQAVLGEYNKNSAAPTSKLDEVLSAAAFDRHPYRHTTMGFLEDIQNMPNLYDYSRQFFDRYYRPEYTTIILAGDISPTTTVPLVQRYWAGWQRGSYQPRIPVEPPQTAPRTAHVNWPSPTLPWLVVAFRVPAYSGTAKDVAALDLIARLGFSSTSSLYQQLVIRDQQVDALFARMPLQTDPGLFTVNVRLKRPADLAAVEQRVLATLDEFRTRPVAVASLEAVKSKVRYGFALKMDNSQA
ncbi:MAG: pitrilysin family protein, partial [Acidobacteria bacterium]|nr:pitrilysin family protein [Acidobacteriota bacterium]